MKASSVLFLSRSGCLLNLKRAILALLIVMAFAVVAVFPVSLVAAPKVAWSPERISEQLEAGESVNIPVTFTTSRSFESLSVRVVPEIAPYVTVDPETISNVERGQIQTLYVSISAPVAAFPSIVSGTIQLRSNGKNSKVKSVPLPVNLEILWEQYPGSELLPDVAFQFNIFGQEGAIREELVEPGVVYNIVEFIDPDTGYAAPQYTINFSENASLMSLIEWFAQYVDLSGSIISMGNYSLTTLTNGVQALTMFGYEIPHEHLELSGPIPDIYAISPSKETLVVIQTNQLQSLGLLGVTSDDRFDTYFEILESMTFE